MTCSSSNWAPEGGRTDFQVTFSVTWSVDVRLAGFTISKAANQRGFLRTTFRDYRERSRGGVGVCVWWNQLRYREPWQGCSKIPEHHYTPTKVCRGPDLYAQHMGTRIKWSKSEDQQVPQLKPEDRQSESDVCLNNIRQQMIKLARPEHFALLCTLPSEVEGRAKHQFPLKTVNSAAQTANKGHRLINCMLFFSLHPGQKNLKTWKFVHSQTLNSQFFIVLLLLLNAEELTNHLDQYSLQVISEVFTCLMWFTESALIGSHRAVPPPLKLQIVFLCGLFPDASICHARQRVHRVPWSDSSSRHVFIPYN